MTLGCVKLTITVDHHREEREPFPSSYKCIYSSVHFRDEGKISRSLLNLNFRPDNTLALPLLKDCR